MVPDLSKRTLKIYGSDGTPPLISVVFAGPSRYFFPWPVPAFVRRSSGITATYFRPPIEAAPGNLMAHGHETYRKAGAQRAR